MSWAGRTDQRCLGAHRRQAIGQLGRELGLSPVSEKALHQSAIIESSHRKWLDLAKDAEVVPPSAAPINGTPPT